MPEVCQAAAHCQLCYVGALYWVHAVSRHLSHIRGLYLFGLCLPVKSAVLTMASHTLKVVRVRCDAGLLNVLADISGMLDSYMDASVHLLRASVKEVIAVPKPEPLPVPKVAPPPPPPPRLAKPTAPPPPPPPGQDTLLGSCACRLGLTLCILNV